MADATAADRLERQQRQDRGQRGNLARAREPRAGDGTGEIQRDQRWEQQHHAGIVTVDLHWLLRPAHHPGARRIITCRSAPLTGWPWPEALVALGDQQLS